MNRLMMNNILVEQPSVIVNNMNGACEHQHDVHTLTPDQIQHRLQTATAYCQATGVRFTSLRRTVYTLILQATKPLGAYELLEQLQTLQKKAVAPPTIYRALSFLLEGGFIHQLTSINAVIPCCHPRGNHNAVFLLCTQCQRVQECSGLPVQEVVMHMREDMGFVVKQSVMELQGICQRCQPSESTVEVTA